MHMNGHCFENTANYTWKFSKAEWTNFSIFRTLYCSHVNTANILCHFKNTPHLVTANGYWSELYVVKCRQCACVRGVVVLLWGAIIMINPNCEYADAKTVVNLALFWETQSVSHSVGHALWWSTLYTEKTEQAPTHTSATCSQWLHTLQVNQNIISIQHAKVQNSGGQRTQIKPLSISHINY